MCRILIVVDLNYITDLCGISCTQGVYCC